MSASSVTDMHAVLNTATVHIGKRNQESIRKCRILFHTLFGLLFAKCMYSSSFI